MDKIISYIKEKYNPLSIIVYGSYANGTNGEHSDFDGLVISRDHEIFHDTAFVHGIQLDLFVYPAEHFEGDFDRDEVLQIFDGKVVLDIEGRGEALKHQVLEHIRQQPKKTAKEVAESFDWCRKMLLRTYRNDAEGLFRWHWLLTDSLEIFCDITGQPYWGPKKSLGWMKCQYPTAYAIYSQALKDFTPSALEAWVEYLEKKCFEQ